MSTLPSYRARDEEEAFVPLLQSDVENAEQDPEHASKGSSHRPPSYPPPISTGPALGAAAFPAVATPATGTSMVTYHYEPRYPLTGDEVYILGYLGSSKQESIATVQRAIPSLAEISTDRIDFKVQRVYYMKETGLGRRRWVSVMDEMWPLFAADPPDELMVQVLDTDETRKARKQRNLLCGVCIFIVILLVIASVGVLASHAGPRR